MAAKAKKMEHAGAKKGRGAFWGPKKEAKQDSNAKRRNADKMAVKEIVAII